jgi:hypothetical protein
MKKETIKSTLETLVNAGLQTEDIYLHPTVAEFKKNTVKWYLNKIKNTKKNENDTTV